MKQLNKKLFFLPFFVLLMSVAHITFAAELNLSPSSGTYNVGDTINVRVVLSTPTESANAVSGTLSFSRNLLTLSSISKSNSLVSLWPVEPSYSNVGGTANMEGVILSGYQGSNGTIVTLSFKAKAIGSANIKFTSSSVLANDGEGSNIIGGTGQANFLINPLKEKASSPTPLPAPTQNVVVLTPVFTDYSLDLKEGEFLVVKGLADSSVDILITSDNFTSSTDQVLHESTNIKSNDQGVFAYVSERVASGMYMITAQARNKDGILSEKTLPIKISVSSTSLPDVGGYLPESIINTFSIVIPIIGLLILLILLMIWGWHHILHYREHMRKKLMDVRNITAKSFDILDEDVKEEVKIFKKIKALQPLTTDERTFVNQFKRDIEEAEKTILNEVKE